MDIVAWLAIFWIFLASAIYFILPKLNHVFPQTTSDGRTSLFNRIIDELWSHVFLSMPATHLGPVCFSSSGPARAEGYADDWLNNVLSWMFHHYQGAPEFLQNWLRSLNDASKRVANVHGLKDLVFENVKPFGERPPMLTDVRTEFGPRDHLTLRGKATLPSFVLHVVASQQFSDGLRVANYDAKISYLHGSVQLRIACIANELFIMACFDGRPDMKVELALNDPPDACYVVDDKLVEESLRKCFIAAVTNFSLTSCRELAQPVEEVYRTLNTVARVQPRAMSFSGSQRYGNQLLVKILNAQNLGGGDVEIQQPYVIVEVDEPSQKYTTSLSSDLCWNEQFSFTITNRSEEILFEIYDKVKGRDPEESQPTTKRNLSARTQNQTELLVLQSRPYQMDSVSGTLSVEFVFVNATEKTNDSRDPLSWSVKEEPRSTVRSKSTIAAVRPLSVNPDVVDFNVKETVPAKVAPMVTKSRSLSKSFTLAEAAQSARDNDDGLHAEETGVAFRSNSFDKENLPLLASSLKLQPVPPSFKAPVTGAEQSPPERQQPTSATDGQAPACAVQLGQSNRNDCVGSERSRAKTRRSNFFADMKQRLSFHRDSASHRDASFDLSDSFAAGASLERNDRSVSTPPSRDSSLSRAVARERSKNKARDTLSTGEISTTSLESVYPQSTLVVEVTENGIVRYFLIPMNLIRTPAAKRVMKRGKKLHIFNEHSFAATHTASAHSCHVCQRNFGWSIGKQAYQCRDCGMFVHKTCHFKADVGCPNSSASTLELEYLWSLPN